MIKFAIVFRRKVMCLHNFLIAMCADMSNQNGSVNKPITRLVCVHVHLSTAFIHVHCTKQKLKIERIFLMQQIRAEIMQIRR